MTIYGLSPIGNEEIHNSAGDPAVGWFLRFYRVGVVLTATKKNEEGSAANGPTITLNARGESPYPIWIDVSTYFTAKVFDTDNNLVFSIDKVRGIYPSNLIGAMQTDVNALKVGEVTDILELQVDTGIANTMVLTPDPAWISYVDGHKILFTPVAENIKTGSTDYVEGAVTVAVSGLAAKKLLHHDGTELKPGDLKVNGVYMATYYNGKFRMEGYTSKFSRVINTGDTQGTGPTLMVNRLSPDDSSAGTPGYINSAISAQVESYEGSEEGFWAVVGVADARSSFPGGGVVGVYGQGNKYDGAAGAGTMTWGGCFEGRDKRTNPEVSNTHLRGVEIALFVNGADTDYARCALDVIARLNDPGGDPGICTNGVIVRNEEPTASFEYGVMVTSSTSSAFTAINTGTVGLWLHPDAELSYGIDMADADISIFGITMGDNHMLNFGKSVSGWSLLKDGVTGSFNLWSHGLDATVAYFDTSGYLNMSVGGINTATRINANHAGGIEVLGVKVLGAQSTGWKFLEGTQDKTSTWNTNAVTTEQLARRVAALELMLATHGMCST